jgi:CBS domain-containing protein
MTFPSIERKAKRLRIYIGDSDQWRGKPLYSVLLEQLKKEGLAGATVIRGVASFGAHSRIHTASILSLSADLPLVIEVVDSAEKIQQALETISPMVREGLITLEDVEVLSYTHRFLRPLPADRHVREIMTKDPVTVRADQPLIEAWQIMLDQNIKALPVVDAGGHVIGLLTHEDLLDRAGLNARLAVAQKLDEESLQAEMDILRQSGKQVGDVMSQPAITIHQDEPVGLAAERLVKQGITRMPVVDEKGNLVGMVSRLDVLRLVMDIPEKEHPQAQTRAAGRLAGEVMSKEVPFVRENTDLAGIIASFLSSGEHRVIVVNDADQPVGLISDSDVVGRIQPAHRRGVLGALRGLVSAPAISVTAQEIMSPGAETITADTSVVEAVRRMVSSQRKWLVVVDETSKPIGLIDREIALECLIH